MIGISWIFMFVLAVTCTQEGSTKSYRDIRAPPPGPFYIMDGLKTAIALNGPLLDAVTAAKNDSHKQKILFRELQEWWHYPFWYHIQMVEWEKSIKVWSTLKTDFDSQKKRLQYTRIRVWLESLEVYFFPQWLSSVKSFTRYEQWLIGCSTCQEERWNFFKQAINDKYGNRTKEGTIALAKAISDLHSEVSSEIPYYYLISLKVPETDREIADLCSVVGEPATFNYLACKLVIKAQSLTDFMLTNEHRTGTEPHSILYGIIRSKSVSETFKVITEYFTNKNLSATTTGVENCIMNVDQFIENTNLVTFFATCPNTVTNEELKKKLLPLIKTHVLNLASDLEIFKQVSYEL